MVEQNPLEKKNDSQIDKAFEAASDSFLKHLNPGYADDPATQEKKGKILKAFETLRKLAQDLGKVVEISDIDIFNLIQSAFLPYSKVESVSDVFETLRAVGYPGEGKIEKIEENKWIVKNAETIRKIGDGLREEHRTLKRANE